MLSLRAREHAGFGRYADRTNSTSSLLFNIFQTGRRGVRQASIIEPCQKLDRPNGDDLECSPPRQPLVHDPQR